MGVSTSNEAGTKFCVSVDVTELLDVPFGAGVILEGNLGLAVGEEIGQIIGVTIGTGSILTMATL